MRRRLPQLLLVLWIAAPALQAVPDLAPVWPETHGEAVVCLWPDGRESAISITIDDNNVPDIPFWRDLGEELDWHFTWFLIVHPMMWDIEADQPGNNQAYFGSPEVFRPLLEAGHELELHGSCKAMNHLDRAAYEAHLLQSKAFLEERLNHSISAYAYPCGEIGPDKSSDVYYRIVQQHFLAARGTRGGPTPVHRIDPHNTHSMGPVGLRKPEADERWFSRLADESRPENYSAYREWGVILYHGLKSDEKKEQVKETLRALKHEEDRFWVAPFTVVARHILQHQAASLEILRAEPGLVEFSLTDSLESDFERVPMTVKIRLDGWENINATRRATQVPARLIQQDGDTYGLVTLPPGPGKVSVRPGL